MIASTLQAVFLSHMFPSCKAPFTTPFMPERAKALSRHILLDIVAPVSYVPYLRNDLPPREEIFDGMKVYHPRYLGMPPFFWSLRWISYFLMCRLFWKNRPPACDLVHIEWIYPDAYAFLNYAKKYHVKTVGVVHGNEAIGYLEQKNHRKYYINALQKLDRIIAVSSDLKKKIVTEYQVAEHKIVVIPNGVDLDKFPIMHKNYACESIGLQTQNHVGVCVARLSQEKNLDVLIKAISLLAEDAPVIYIIGDGPLKERLEILTDQLQLREKVIFVGSVPHNKIYEWLNAADFFCLPSQREGCPVVIHEALACGVPIVSTNVGAIPDLVCKDDYGLLCQPSDPIALRDLIIRAVKTSWDREKISAYGRRFTWDAVAQQTVKVFEEVMG